MSEVSVTWRTAIGINRHAYIDGSYNTVCGLPSWLFSSREVSDDSDIEPCPNCQERLSIIRSAMEYNNSEGHVSI